MKNLVIVESPSKSKTIAKYLGKDYTVVSSKGHIRDLAIKGKDGLGVDIENDFEPTYVVSKDKTDTVKDLQKQAKKAEIRAIRRYGMVSRKNVLNLGIPMMLAAS